MRRIARERRLDGVDEHLVVAFGRRASVTLLGGSVTEARVIGAFGGFVGLAGLLAGGSACIGGLLVADDAAADFEAAYHRASRAAERAGTARIMWFLCMQKHQMGASRSDASVS
ncbi:MAG: hypothetical protein KUG77_02535 [Nannocystaceae bacterium]|nr:hypothetical protein [Nannocystaceae bacterium]